MVSVGLCARCPKSRRLYFRGPQNQAIIAAAPMAVLIALFYGAAATPLAPWIPCISACFRAP